MTTQMQDASQSLTSAAPLRAARWWAGGCLLIAAAVHVPVIAPHLSEAPYIGVLFILLTAACVILTPALVAYDSRILWVIAGVVTLLAVIVYVLARTIGLPQIADDIGIGPIRSELRPSPPNHSPSWSPAWYSSRGAAPAVFR
jgi:hypothetical protein